MIHLYAQLKDLIEAVIGLDRNVLHVHLGIVLFMLLAWCFPQPHRYRRALVWLLVIAVLNEVFDVLMAFDKGKRPNWSDDIADIINTLFWPAVWCVFRHRLARAFPPSAGARDLAPPVERDKNQDSAHG